MDCFVALFELLGFGQILALSIFLYRRCALARSPFDEGGYRPRPVYDGFVVDRFLFWRVSGGFCLIERSLYFLPFLFAYCFRSYWIFGIKFFFTFYRSSLSISSGNHTLIYVQLIPNSILQYQSCAVSILSLNYWYCSTVTLTVGQSIPRWQWLAMTRYWSSALSITIFVSNLIFWSCHRQPS